MSHYPCILNVRKRSQYDRSNPTLAKERLRQVFVRRFAWTKAFCVCDEFAWLKCEITLIRYRNNGADILPRTRNERCVLILTWFYWYHIVLSSLFLLLLFHFFPLLALFSYEECNIHMQINFLICFTSAFIILTHSYSHHLQLAK